VECQYSFFLCGWWLGGLYPILHEFLLGEDLDRSFVSMLNNAIVARIDSHLLFHNTRWGFAGSDDSVAAVERIVVIRDRVYRVPCEKRRPDLPAR